MVIKKKKIKIMNERKKKQLSTTQEDLLFNPSQPRKCLWLEVIGLLKTSDLANEGETKSDISSFPVSNAVRKQDLDKLLN